VTDLPHLSGKWGRLLLNMPLVKIGKAAGLLGVSVQTLRKLEDSGELVPDRRSEGGVRYYDMGKNPRATEVSLRRQKHCLELVPALIRSKRRRDLPGLASDAPHLRTDQVPIKTAHSKMRWH
jgi:hypothetical protein